MSRQPLAYIVGDSLMMDGIAESLTKANSVRIIQADSSIPDLTECARRLNPDLIIFELDSPQSRLILALLHQLPGTLLIGLELTSSRVVVMNSRESQARTSRELFRAFLAVVGGEFDLVEGEQMAQMTQDRSLN